jgi:hypothetical protein
MVARQEGVTCAFLILFVISGCSAIVADGCYDSTPIRNSTVSLGFVDASKHTVYYIPIKQNIFDALSNGLTESSCACVNVEPLMIDGTPVAVVDIHSASDVQAIQRLSVEISDSSKRKVLCVEFSYFSPSLGAMK